MLTRDERSFGSIEHDSRHSAVDGCDLFEGDPKSPQMCRGSFQCSDPHFAARSGWDLLLILSKNSGADRILNVRIRHVTRSKPLWEFGPKQ
jgi:hypothetical protein